MALPLRLTATLCTSLPDRPARSGVSARQCERMYSLTFPMSASAVGSPRRNSSAECPGWEIRSRCPGHLAVAGRAGRLRIVAGLAAIWAQQIARLRAPAGLRKAA